MYLMLSVFILTLFALLVFIMCHVPNVVRVHSYFFCFACLHYVSCTQCCPCSFLLFLLCLSSFCVMYPMSPVFILTFFLLCLSSFCVMYPMLSVFILIFFALFVFILCHVPNVVRVHSYFVCFVCLHYVSCT